MWYLAHVLSFIRAHDGNMIVVGKLLRIWLPVNV